MKKTLLLLTALALSLGALAQVPQRISYQAILRDAGGAIQPNTSATLGLAVLQGSAGGPVVYNENHAVTTNGFGLANVPLGGGTVVSGNFAQIDWSAGPYFVRTSVNGTPLGTSQLLSVPYALFAEQSNTPGPQGEQGEPGPQGPPGADGTGVTILGSLTNVNQLPTGGEPGDAYLVNGSLYVWSETTNDWENVGSIQGPAGATGPAGADGRTILNGASNPAAGTGSNGDFYINTATNTLFGPKTGGVWGSGTSLIGPIGPQGLTGPQGIAGPAGATGSTGPQGAQGVQGPVGATGPQGPAGADGTGVTILGTLLNEGQLPGTG
ncbi:MAG: collagen-like protein [Flavobacteriales bacterium]|nr:collagen-like protein [Flavobacteriales bacterium]